MDYKKLEESIDRINDKDHKERQSLRAARSSDWSIFDDEPVKFMGSLILMAIFAFAGYWIISGFLNLSPGSGGYRDWNEPSSNAPGHPDTIWVDDYYRGDGTHVDGHERGWPDGIESNNLGN